MESRGKPLAIAGMGKAERLHMTLPGLADEVAKIERSADETIAEAGTVIAHETTTDLQPLGARLRDRTARADY